MLPLPMNPRRKVTTGELDAREAIAWESGVERSRANKGTRGASKGTRKRASEKVSKQETTEGGRAQIDVVAGRGIEGAVYGEDTARGGTAGEPPGGIRPETKSTTTFE